MGSTADDKPTIVISPGGAGHGPAAPGGGPAPGGGGGGGGDGSPWPTVPGFEILGELGTGGTAVVYKARRASDGAVVALKMLLAGPTVSAEEMERFRFEAETLRSLAHPDIVQVVEFGELGGQWRGRPYMALEWVEGGSLSARIGREPQDPRWSAAMAARIARAVHAAHERKVIHRDLKPSNVLMTADGSPKVADFGLAKRLDSSSVGLTATTAVLGTPSYMSPEQAAGRSRGVAVTADVYSLGAILYALLTGRPPFSADSYAATVMQVLYEEPPAPSSVAAGIPRDLETICLTCLRKDPAARYESAADLAVDLERWLKGERITARRRTLSRWLAKNRAWVTAGAAAVVAVVIGWALLADAGFGIPGGRALRDRLDAAGLSLMRPVPDEAALRRTAAEYRVRLAGRLAGMTAGPGGVWLCSVQGGRPEPPDAWTQGQGLSALAAAPETDPETLRKLSVSVDRMFADIPGTPRFLPGRGCEYKTGCGYAAFEPTVWVAAGAAHLLARPGLLTGTGRERMLARLDELQATMDRHRCRPDGGAGKPSSGDDGWNGGWNMFAGQRDPSRWSIYSTCMALHALLEMRSAGVGWRGDAAALDRRLRATAGLVAAAFRPDLGGWVVPGPRVSAANDGATVVAMALLLRAEAEAGLPLPEAVAARVPDRLGELAGRPLDFPISAGEFFESFTDDSGRVHENVGQPIKFLWYPWGIDCAVRWLDRVARTGGPVGETARTRRVLGHLLQGIGPAAVEEASAGWAWLAGETLLGLSSVPKPE